MTSHALELQKQERWRCDRFPRASQFFDGLLHSEFQPAAWQGQFQAAAVRELVRFVVSEVPYYRELFAELSLTVNDIKGPDDLPRLPVLSKSMVAAQGERLRPRRLPEGESEGGITASSGTTGQPVKIAHSASSVKLYSLLWQRQARWFNLEPSAIMLDVRIGREVARSVGGAPNPDGTLVKRDRWRYLGPFFKTGPEFGFNISTPLDQQVAWLRQVQPEYALTYPGTFEEWLLAGGGTPPVGSLQRLIAIGAQLTPSLRERLETAYGIPIHQTYGLNEIGKVALRCEAGRYHIHTEGCLVEIVDSAGQPCAPGETGRVVVTALRNAAMPLLRYDTGDLAEATAGPCACGRTLPSFGELAGRFRRFAGLPGGTRERVNGLLAALGKLAADEVDFLRRYQIFQDRHNRFALRLQTAGPVPESFRHALRDAWQEITGTRDNPLTLDVVAQIAASPSGKQLDFVSEFYRDSYANCRPDRDAATTADDSSHEPVQL
ncbi:MAG: AMP-binding protein [Pirellulaceae bacterium]|nr:AMP-binding protein [Pirellulaceae bacterium]